MIRYALNCDNGHVFESWFANSAAYDKQAKRKLVTCPVCDSAEVEKAIMAPRLGPSLNSEAAEPRPPSPTPPNLAPPSPLQPGPMPPIPPKTTAAMISTAER